MDNFGYLRVFMFILLPNGREKRVNLATIPCNYSERHTAFRQFMDDNSVTLMKAHCGAQFVMNELVNL